MKGSTALGLGLASAAALGLGYFVFTVRHTEDIAQTPAARASEGASITTVDDRDVSYNNRTVNRTDIINYEVSTNPSFPEVSTPTEKSISQDKPGSTPKEPFPILPEYDPETGITTTVEKQQAENIEIPIEWKQDQGTWYWREKGGEWQQSAY